RAVVHGAGRVEPVSSAGAQPRSPVRWARWGQASRLLAHRLAPKTPAVLILSLPRSGSSWVGDTLGRAADALYLREPINQSCLVPAKRDALMAVPAGAPPADFAAAAERSFGGWPAFPGSIVTFPWQWRLRERHQRRLVIKEVIPRACAYFCQRFQPRLIFLVRHPAAVALSFVDRGWWSPQRSSWEELGARQGRILREVQDSLAGYPDSRVVLYEDLCLDPVTAFENLFAYAGLAWDSPLAGYVAQSTSRGDTNDPYSTTRHS
ncbi:MAG: sulfotransferase, partial [Anaerolineales bacterium]